MQYTTIFLDLDDTLLDTIGNAKETLEEIYTDYHIEKYYPTYKDFADVYFPHNNELWEKYSMGKIDKPTLLADRFMFPFRNHKDVTLEMANKMNEDFLSRVKYKKRTIEGTKELLDYLKPKYKIHILSNGFTELQYHKIESAGLNGYFDSVILSDVVGVNKPHPDIFLYALYTTKTNEDEVIMIGDNLISDISGAQGAGIDQIWFNPDGKDSGEIKPTYEVDALLRIKDIL